MFYHEILNPLVAQDEEDEGKNESAEDEEGKEEEEEEKVGEGDTDEETI